MVLNMPIHTTSSYQILLMNNIDTALTQENIERHIYIDIDIYINIYNTYTKSFE